MKLPEDNKLGNFTGIQQSVNEKNVTVNYQNGRLTVSGADGRKVNVYSVAGSLTNTFTAEGDVYTVNINLAKGFYVVAAGDFRQTIIAQ